MPTPKELRKRNHMGQFECGSFVQGFWSGVDKVSADPCWEWTKAVDGKGYGMFGAGNKSYKSHRASYELHKGPIPQGLQIDHLCRNRRCVSPDHLEAVTCRENILRGQGIAAKRSRQTHCKRMHEFTVENTRLNAYGGRICRTCQRQRNKAYKSHSKKTFRSK